MKTTPIERVFNILARYIENEPSSKVVKSEVKAALISLAQTINNVRDKIFFINNRSELFLLFEPELLDEEYFLRIEQVTDRLLKVPVSVLLRRQGSDDLQKNIVLYKNAVGSQLVAFHNAQHHNFENFKHLEWK